MNSSDASPYIPVDHPLLRQKAETVQLSQIGTPEIEGIIEKMLLIAREERLSCSMVGLAAPQIGIPKAVVLVDLLVTEARDPEVFRLDPEVFINPIIIWYSEELEEYREGCFSTGCICGLVPRPSAIQVEALSRTGEKVNLELEGYTARIFQHEVDHLHGIRFPDRMKDFSKLHFVSKEDREAYRQNSATWPHKCSFEKWKEISGFQPPIGK